MAQISVVQSLRDLVEKYPQWLGLNQGFQGKGIVFNCRVYTQTKTKTGLIFAQSLVAQYVHIYVA